MAIYVRINITVTDRHAHGNSELAELVAIACSS